MSASGTLENWKNRAKINFPLRVSYEKAKSYLKNFISYLIFCPNVQNVAAVSSLENWRFCTNQIKSPRPVTWVTWSVLGNMVLNAPVSMATKPDSMAAGTVSMATSSWPAAILKTRWPYPPLLGLKSIVLPHPPPARGVMATQLLTMSLANILFFAHLA